MFLKTLALENVRCFEAATINFDLGIDHADDDDGKNRKWTVIVGENGGGKTTVLQSIALLMAGSDALPELLDDVDGWIRQGADEATISGELETAKGESRDIALVFRRGDSAQDVIDRSRETLALLNAALEHTTRSYLTIGYGTSRRRTRDIELSRTQMARYGQPRARSLASLFNRDLFLHPLEHWIGELTGDTSRDTSAIMGIIVDIVVKFLPELTFTRIEPDGSIVFTTPDGDVPLDNLGNGYQSLTAFVGDLLYQLTNIFQDFKNPLDARALLLVDSIGMDLHPKLQRRVLAFLDERLPNMQVIVTTQSLVITQQSAADALHYCIRKDRGMGIDQFEGEPRKLRLDQLMMTEAFGDSTYESLEVEDKKRRYRELEAKEALSPDEADEMDEIRVDIGSIATEDMAASMTSEQVQLLQEVRQALARSRQ